jgi:hypothetical protein
VRQEGNEFYEVQEQNRRFQRCGSRYGWRLKVFRNCAVDGAEDDGCGFLVGQLMEDGRTVNMILDVCG